MEVTVVSSDVAAWSEVAVPPKTVSAEPCEALIDYLPVGVGGASISGSNTQSVKSSPYVVWRIHEEVPKTLELIELSCDRTANNSGLRLVFESSLCPFASVVLAQVINSSWLLYEVAVLTVTGVLYSIVVKVARSSRGKFFIQHESTAGCDVSGDLSKLRKVTSVTATPELLIVGGLSGSILCFPVGNKAERPRDFPFELRDSESGISRLLGLGFRGKGCSPVKCLTARNISGVSLLFSVYEDRSLKIWDLRQRNRLFSQMITPPLESVNPFPTLMWIEDAVVLGQGLQFALFYGGSPSFEYGKAAMLVGTIHSSQVDGTIRLSHLTLRRTYTSGLRDVISCKLLQDRVWVLQKTSKGHYELRSANLNDGSNLRKCCPQESAVAGQLFQGTGQDWDELIFTLHHIGLDSSSTDGDSVPDLFLRRLLQPGVRLHAALKDVLRMRRKHLSDFEIGTLTLDGLRKEIKSFIKSEPSNSRRSLKEWMNFCGSYVESWNHNSIPYGLHADVSTGSVGLIRKNSVSVIRSLTLLEQLVSKRGTVDAEDVSLPQEWEEGIGDSAVLGGLLRCMEMITGHLGQMALGVFHEALLRTPSYSLDSLVGSFLLILDVGYSPLDSAHENLSFGVDEIRSNMQLHHQRQRKFALRISQALYELRETAGSWEVVLDVISKFAQYLVFSTQPAQPVSTSDAVPLGSVLTKMLTQATCQISWSHFEASRNLLLLLSYMVKVQAQVCLTQSEVTRIQLQVLPRVQEGLSINLLLHWLTVSFAEVPPSEDCSLQLSSLHIDGSRGEKVQPEKLGAGELALTEILAAAFLETTQVQETFRKDCLPNPDLLHNYAWRFIGWLLVGESSHSYPLTFSGRAIALSSILLQHGQYGSLESFLNAVEQFSAQQHLTDGVASIDGEWSARLHLLGICGLARAHSVLENTMKEKHVGESIQCFFRAASGLGEANKVLQSVFFVPQQEQLHGRGPTAAWRLQYFEWVMQLFDQYNLSEGACQFAHAALEQVDEAVGLSVVKNSETNPNVSIKGRLWANVFKFSLDLELYGNAYCAIVSNPDEESRDMCLRRFVIVLCDHKASQALCGNELPFGELLGKVEEELVTKAYNSDVSVKAGLFKRLYALHMHHHNVGRAAGYMYQYALCLRDQGLSKSHAQSLLLLQEELDAFAAAINALQLVDPSDELVSDHIEWLSPIKRRRISAAKLSNGQEIHENGITVHERKYLDVEQLVKEHALTLARLQLLNAGANYSSLGKMLPPSEVVLSLLQHGLYEMGFSLVFLFWKESSQKEELEHVFEIMTRRCCLLQLQLGSNSSPKHSEDFQLALAVVPDSPPRDVDHSDGPLSIYNKNNAKVPSGACARSAWQSLRDNLGKYWKLHPNLRVVVAETILSVDKHMELPLWLIDTFKSGGDYRSMNLSTSVADPASLLRIYMDHERYLEAAYLLLDYLQAATRLRPEDVIKRKQACGVWFPYTLVDRLLQHLSEICLSDDLTSQSERLRLSLEDAVLHHFDLIKKESDDVRVIAEAADLNGPWKGFS